MIIVWLCRLCDIGEDLLVDITEVLFNELSCYQLLKDDGYATTVNIIVCVVLFV
jgi:hypothetical protein